MWYIKENINEMEVEEDKSENTNINNDLNVQCIIRGV